MRTHRLRPARPGVAEPLELGWAESTVRAHVKRRLGHILVPPPLNRPAARPKRIIRIETNGVLWKLCRRPQRVCPLACGFYLFPKTIQILVPVVSGEIYALWYRRFGPPRGRKFVGVFQAMDVNT